MKKIILLQFVCLMFVLSAGMAQNLMKEAGDLYDSQEYKQAIEKYDLLLKKEINNDKAYFKRAECHYELEQYNEAIADYSKAIKIAPAKSWEYYRGRGDSYYLATLNKKTDKVLYKEALADFNKAIQMNTEPNAAAYFNRGNTKMQLDDTNGALTDYNKAVSINSNKPAYFFARAEVHKKLAKNTEACEDYKKAHDLGEKNAKAKAKELSCQWATPAIAKNVPTGQVHTISKIEIDPFTGMKFFSKGLTYEKYELATEKDAAIITSNEFAPDEEFHLKITKPVGFVPNEQNKALFGIGYSVYDTEGKELGKVADLYEKHEGYDIEKLGSLKLLLFFSDALKKDKTYLLKARFFDKIGGGEILVEMYFKMEAATSKFVEPKIVNNSITTGSITKSANGVEIKEINFEEDGIADVLPPEKIKSHHNVHLILKKIKGLEEHISYKIRIVNALTGEEIRTKDGKAQVKIVENNIVRLAIGNLKKGNYKVFMHLHNTTSTATQFGLEVPIVVEDK